MSKWRLIVDPDLSGVENMAIDEVLLTGVESGTGDMPVLRLYGWSEPTVSVGYAQDPSVFTRAGLPVVRRITGGRAVIHDDEVTYSLSAPSSHPLFAGGIASSYTVISGCIIAALNDIGVSATLSRPQGREKGAAGQKDACFYTPSRSEVLVEGRKLVGSSQRRFKSAFLQHGSILFAIDAEAHDALFGPGVVEKMACVSSFSRAGKEALRHALVERFSEGLGADFTEGVLTDAERIEVQGLVSGRNSPRERARALSSESA